VQPRVGTIDGDFPPTRKSRPGSERPVYLEPILFRHAAATPGLTVLSRTRVLGCRQDERGVTASAERLDSGEQIALRWRYLIGCEGGRSQIRRAAGVTPRGDPVVSRVQSTLIRAPELLSQIDRHDV
jgi:2-polyprenyl-6-methoxyphenol hydroxylase-like FAD-dependent oxidoreductase